MIEKQKIGLLVIGLILSVVGFIISQFWKDIILTRFYSEIPIKPGTLAYKRWTGAKDPIKSTFYFWNWTNPEQITNEKVKPHFVEMGPYIFWQFREKINVTYNCENATVSYRNKYSFYFDPELSNGTLSDNVTSINAIAASAAYMTRNWSRLILYPLSLFLRSSGQQIWWTKNVSQLLFDGFDDPVLQVSHYVPGLHLPEKFAYLYGFNDTVQPGLINIDSGKNDVNKIGEIYYVDYSNESDLYTDPGCKEIKGTNSDFFAPFVTPKRRLQYYIPELCRKVVRYYDGESTYEGLKTYVFSSTDKMFDNGSTIPENKCYCIDEDCPRSGIMDLSRCRKGPPVASSLPHFLFADPYYRNSIEGMNPVEWKHKLYSALEPTTGVQVNASIRLQANLRLTRNPGLSLYRNVPDIYIPVFWQETKILINGEYLSAIKLLTFCLDYGPIMWYIISGLGVTIAAFVALVHFYNQNSLEHVKLHLKTGSKKGEERKLKDGEKEKETVKYAFSNDHS